jgi:hypothetical protein
MKLLTFFGTKLSAMVGKELHHSVSLSIGLIRLSISDAGMNPDAQLTYRDLKGVFQNQLVERLEMLGINNPNDVSARMVNALSENQSLFTMAVR